jgi:drug/metabolite transporter (DMT)-like permease
MSINRKAIRADILLLLTAGIWGFGFVAQRSGMEYVGPFAFNGLRFILGSFSLLPLILYRRRNQIGAGAASGLKRFFFYSLAAGSCLFVAVELQQFGIMFTSAGNAGFITGLYVVLTPIFGIFLGRKTGPATWLGSVFTLTGLYFLSAAGIDSINPGDIITVISAVFWAFHVLLIDRLVRDTDPIALSAGQFAVCGIFALAGAFLAEPFLATLAERIDPSLLSSGLFAWRPFPALLTELSTGAVHFPAEAIIPVLYGGFGSVGIAYTLQVVAQRDAPPAHATIILCFEGCFAALGGVLLLGEKISPWTLLGFILMLTGMLVTQWEVIAGRKSSRA